MSCQKLFFCVTVMPSNVEIKASVSDQAEFAEKAAQLSGSEGTISRQRDTFFNCSQGRLKLRDFMVCVCVCVRMLYLNLSRARLKQREKLKLCQERNKKADIDAH